MGDILIRGVEMPKSKSVSLFLLPNGSVFCDGVCLAQKFAFFTERDGMITSLDKGKELEDGFNALLY